MRVNEALVHNLIAEFAFHLKCYESAWLAYYKIMSQSTRKWQSIEKNQKSFFSKPIKFVYLLQDWQLAHILMGAITGDLAAITNKYNDKWHFWLIFISS